MSADAILDEVRARGIELAVAGDRLRFRPVAAMTPDLRDKLARHKAALLHTLAVAALPAAWREQYEERAAIMEFDANMIRADAEHFALAEVQKLMRDCAS